jgi:ParB/RepB/Spo0J family partition protein
MPKKLDLEGATRGTIFMVPPESITVDPEFNGRRFDSSVDDLAVSITKNGQLEPILCRRENGGLKVIYGFRRLAAIRSINEAQLTEKPLKVKVDIRDCDDVTALELNARENHDRNDLTPIDVAYLASRFVRMGKEQQAVAEMFNKSEAWISQILTLLKLPVASQRKVHEGKIPLSIAYEAAKADSKEEQEKILEGAEAGETRAQVREKKATKKAVASGLASAPLTAKKVRSFFEDFQETEDEKQDSRLTELSKSILEWLEGEITNRAMKGRLLKLFQK